MVYCFDIGGSFIKFGVPDAAGLVTESGRVPTPLNSFDELVEVLVSSIRSMPASFAPLVSISLAGIINPNSQLTSVANIPCLNDRRLKGDLEKKLGLPVVISNDADCFALAEARLGAGRGHTNVFCIILGSGVGGGMVFNGDLLSGFGGFGGEWGHGPSVDPGAGGLIEPLKRMRCACGGVGCLDTVGGARGLERLHWAIHAEQAGSTDIIARWLNGESEAALSVKVLVEHVSRALSVVVNTFGASIVPVGGGLSHSVELVSLIDRRVRALTLADYVQPLVVPGKHAQDGGLIGAALAGEDLRQALSGKELAE